MHCSKLDKADKITFKIGRLIDEKLCNFLCNVDATSTKQLWDSVKAASCHCNTSDELFSCVGDENVISKFFADIATDPVYNKREILHKPVIDKTAEASKLHHMEDFEVQRLLVAIKKTSSGDEPILPYWLFKNCCFALANVVAYIINLSISCGRSSNNWSNAIITSVPKVTPPKCLLDLRPISVTLILSRLCERCVVKQHLLPAIRRVAGRKLMINLLSGLLAAQWLHLFILLIYITSCNTITSDE